MRTATKFLALLVWLPVAASCSTTRIPPPASIAQKNQLIHNTAMRVAVGKVGAKVCRIIIVGIAGRDTIKAHVAEVSADKIRLKIDDPGNYPHALGGIGVAKDAFLWDEPLNWIPCA